MTGLQLIAQASMENRPVRVEALRAAAVNEKHFAELYREAEQWGVAVHGKLHYSEKKALGFVR